jgi:hypothetical protein
MAAGLGFKTFTTGEVLTAGDVNGYLMQGINVFTNAAGRSAAITSPQEGQYSFLKDTNALEYYDGVAWVGAPVGDITAVTAGTGISGGGSSGAVTITNSMATEIAAKGDLIAGTGSQTFDNLTVGANDTVLTADSTTATGLKWATPAASTPTFAGCRLTKSAAQAIPNNTETALTFDTETFDTDGYHSTVTNTSRITIPTGKGGYYQLSAACAFDGSSTTGARYAHLFKNGSKIWTGTGFAPTNTNALETLTYTQIAAAVATDYFEFFVSHDRGSNYDVRGGVLTTFQATYLGA